MAAEIELKLTLSPGDVSRLRRSPVIAAAARSRPVTRTLHSVYFDTPDRALADARMALRVRRAGRRWIQTFKCGGGSEAGLHQRAEFETVVPGAALDLAALVDTPAAALLADAGFRERLGPAFATVFRRTTWTVEIHPGETAELALDVGEVTAGEASTPICEVEIELVAGQPANLFAFARQLLADVPLRLENVSKAARGYALLTHRMPEPVRAEAPALRADMSVGEAFAAVAASCLRQLQANEAGVADSGDPEFVHQARVAIRRLRSAFGMFRDVVPDVVTPARREAWRALGTALGGARDWDVLVTDTLPGIMAALPREPALAAVQAAAGSRRDAARQIARQALASPRTTELMLDLAGAVLASAGTGAATAVEFARVVLARRAKRVRRQARAVDRGRPETLHALRIEVKKLRYAVEFFQALFPRQAVRDYLRGAARLQEILGHLNDAAVTGLLVDALGRDSEQLSHGTGILRGWVEARAHADLLRFDAAWRRFGKSGSFW